jgi:hypothetical protein
MRKSGDETGPATQRVSFVYLLVLRFSPLDTNIQGHQDRTLFVGILVLRNTHIHITHDCILPSHIPYVEQAQSYTGTGWYCASLKGKTRLIGIVETSPRHFSSRARYLSTRFLLDFVTQTAPPCHPSSGGGLYSAKQTKGEHTTEQLHHTDTHGRSISPLPPTLPMAPLRNTPASTLDYHIGTVSKNRLSPFSSCQRTPGLYKGSRSGVRERERGKGGKMTRRESWEESKAEWRYDPFHHPANITSQLTGAGRRRQR